MFGSLGFPEILLILVLALLIFGPKRLPEVGRTVGKGLAEFRRASADLKRTVNAELALDEDEHTRAPRRPEPSRALAGGAAAGKASEPGVELRPAEGTAPRGTAATARSLDAPPAEAPAPESPSSEPPIEPEPESAAEPDTESAATTH